MSGFRISRLRVYTVIDDKDDEGVVAFFGNDGAWMPLVSADERRDTDWNKLAQMVANNTSKAVQVSEFTLRTDLEPIKPQGHD